MLLAHYMLKIMLIFCSTNWTVASFFIWLRKSRSSFLLASIPYPSFKIFKFLLLSSFQNNFVNLWHKSRSIILGISIKLRKGIGWGPRFSMKFRTKGGLYIVFVKCMMLKGEAMYLTVGVAIWWFYEQDRKSVV